MKSNAVHTPQQIAVPPTQAEPTGLIQRKCACGGKSAASDICTKCKDQELTGFQPSLLVNKPGDRWERQADRVASQVKLGKGLNENILPVTSANLQRSPTVQETSHLGSSNLGSGRSLSDTTRSQMESQFGHNFSDVRIHDGLAAANAASSVQARAFTQGKQIVFGVGQYNPATKAGNELLAHELTHTLQQSGGSAGAILQKACDPAALSTRKELIYFPMERSLRKVLEGKWILKKGSSSYQANGLIQQALVDMGYNLGTTGRNKDGIDKAFKGKTVDAIKEFQTKIMNKATPNGYLDKDTLLCLDDARAKTSVAKHLPGSIKDEQVQVLGEGHSSGDDGATARIYFARGDATLDIEDTISIFETLSNKHLKGKSLQLDGYVSEQERNEYGSNLAKKRNEAVKKDLVYFGVDQAKINTTEKVDAGKGQAKYRGLQKVEISEQGSKTNTADCSKGSAKKRSLNATEEPVANKSIDEAVKYVDKAMSDATMDSKKGEKAIGTFFGSVSKKSKVKRNLKKWHKHLDKNVKRRKRRGTKCDAGCTSAIAYNNNTGSRAMMTLCESFFEDASVKHIYKDLTAEQGRAMIIAHEAGHGSIDTEDVAYDTRRLIKFVHESPDLALKNTDSYIFYIRCVNGLGSSCAPPDRKDMISGGLSAGELTNAKRGVAWLGTWLEWAYQDIIGLYSDSAESRDKKKWTDEYYLQNILPLVEKTFKLHRPKDVMTTAGEQQIFAAIGDRYRSMILVSEKPLELDKDSASSAATKWEKGSGRPGKKVTFAKDYLALTTNRARVEKLLPLIIQATPIIASSLHGAYESFVKLTVKETWEDKP